MALKDPKFPFGAASVATLTAADATQAVTIENMHTIIDGKTNAGSANRTINLTIGDNVTNGATITLLSKTTGTETTTLGTGFTVAAAITGVAGKTKTCKYEYNSVTATFISVAPVGQLEA